VVQGFETVFGGDVTTEPLNPVLRSRAIIAVAGFAMAFRDLS
jgi:hypothetical protein